MMNERIRELAEQAGVSSLWMSGTDQQGNPILEKFAQLIVNECMNQVREQYLPVLEDELMMKDTHWDGYVQCGVDSHVAIRQHFYGEQ
jgi:hypothetical protein